MSTATVVHGLVTSVARPLTRTLRTSASAPNQLFSYSPSRTISPAFRPTSEMAGLSYYYDQIRRGFSTVLNGLSTRLYGRGGEVEAAEEALQPAPEWGYDEHNGPATWAQTFPAARGLSQSPIDLRYETTSYDG